MSMKMRANTMVEKDNFSNRTIKLYCENMRKRQNKI